jgi:hypothetical protein
MSRIDANFPAETATRRPMALRLFGPSPIMEGEDITLYDDLLTRISTAVKPKDILEDIWVREVVDLTWETFRLRRLKWTLLTATAGEGLTKVLGPLIGWGQADDLARAWFTRKPSAIKRVKKILASADLSVDAIMAQTLSIKLDDIERIDRMIAIAEARRNAILREINRHREVLSQNLRRAVQDVEDGPLQVIENMSVKGEMRGEQRTQDKI